MRINIFTGRIYTDKLVACTDEIFMEVFCTALVFKNMVEITDVYPLCMLSLQ